MEKLWNILFNSPASQTGQHIPGNLTGRLQDKDGQFFV